MRTTRDALTEVERDASVATLLFEWGESPGPIDTGRIVQRMSEVGPEAPVFIVISNRDDLPRVRQLRTERIAGFILADEDTPDFIARFVKRHFDDYLQSLKTPFFGALADYNHRSAEAWDCSLRHEFRGDARGSRHHRDALDAQAAIGFLQASQICVK